MREEPMFCPGDKAVCVNSYAPNGHISRLTEGKVYTILAIKRDCCHVIVDVGIRADGKFNSHCPTCRGIEKIESGGILWRVQNRFAPIDAIESIESQVFEALKGQTIKL